MTVMASAPVRPPGSVQPAALAATRGAGDRVVDHLGLASLNLAHPAVGIAMSHEPESWPFLVIFGLAGQSAIEREQLCLSQGEDDLTVLANRAPLRAWSARGSRLLVVGIPQSAVGPHREGLAKADSMLMHTRDGIPSLVGQLMRGLATQGQASRQSTRLARHVVGLIAVVCSDVLDQRSISEGRATIQDAKEYIEQHLHDPDLTPARTAAALYVSTRTLHRMFETERSSVSGWIRWRRLEQCRLELGDQSSGGIPVGQVGAKWGFGDAASFSRLFRATYGIPPAAYRASREGGRDPAVPVARVRS